MRTFKAVFRVGAAAVAIGLLTAACSTTELLDEAELEDKMRTFMEGKLGTPLEAISCPEREMKAGDVFECEARFDNQTIRMRVTQQDDDGDVTFEQVQAVIETAKLVAYVEEQIEILTGERSQADCGPRRLVVRAPGETIDCQATYLSTGEVQRATATFTDADGAFELLFE